MVTSLALFTMLRFPLSFLFIIIIQFQNMKVSLKRISDFLSNTEIDPDALQGRDALKAAPPTAHALGGPAPPQLAAEVAAGAPGAMEVTVQRASPGKHAPISAASVHIVEVKGEIVELVEMPQQQQPSSREALPASPPPSPPGLGHGGYGSRGGRGGRGGRGRGTVVAPSLPPSPPAEVETEDEAAGPCATVSGSFYWEPPEVPVPSKGKGKGAKKKKGAKPKAGGRGGGTASPSPSASPSASPSVSRRALMRKFTASRFYEEKRTAAIDLSEIADGTVTQPSPEPNPKPNLALTLTLTLNPQP